MVKTLSLNPVVDIKVYISPTAAPRRSFNEGLIVGTSQVISTYERMRQYTAVDDMLTDGFPNDSLEVLAAQLYFSASPAPTFLWVGRRNTTASFTATCATAEDSAVITPADRLGIGIGQTVTGAGIPAATKVLSIDTVAGTVTLDKQATATGAAVELTFAEAVETCLQAVQACRAKGSDWYASTVLGAAKDDHLAIAAYVESATPTTVYMGTTQDADVPSGTAGNVLLTLQALEYSRTFVQYSSTCAYAAASAMGDAMGLNTGLANSAYTLKFKQEVGVTAESLDATQVKAIKDANGNVYVNRGTYYNMLEEGVMVNGQFFDEIINLDMLTNDIQLNVMDLLYGTPKIPQTDPSVTQIIHAVNEACDDSVTIGFLAPGTWTGQKVLNLNPGDTLNKGYLVQAPPVSSQSRADREARKSPPIYCAVKEAGAIHSVLIGVYVNR